MMSRLDFFNSSMNNSKNNSIMNNKNGFLDLFTYNEI